MGGVGGCLPGCAEPGGVATGLGAVVIYGVSQYVYYQHQAPTMINPLRWHESNDKQSHGKYGRQKILEDIMVWSIVS